MENIYDVGVTNRYALFLEEGDSSLPDIKKKYTKELRAKNKQEKKEKESTETKKTDEKFSEESKKPDLKPVTEETASLKKEAKESKNVSKNEVVKGKEKKQHEVDMNKREKEPQEKLQNLKNGNDPIVEIENWDEGANKPVDVVPRKNYENRKPRERKYDNSNQYQPRSYSNQKRLNKNDSGKNENIAADSTFDQQFQNEDGNIKENGYSSQNSQNDYRPRGGGRFRGNTRGGRNNNAGGDRRKDFNEQRFEPKEENDNNKVTDTWGEEKAETIVENRDNQNEEAKIENEVSSTIEQKEEEKEYLTLDEWKKLRGQREKPQYNLRKAGEGEDLSQWKNMRELPKEKETEILENGLSSVNSSKKNDSEKENNGNENVQRATRQKHIDIDIHFKGHSTRGRGGRIIRSNRFGYRGGRNDDRSDAYSGESRSFRKSRDGHPGGRGGNRQNAPKMDDEHDFPSLG